MRMRRWARSPQRGGAIVLLSAVALLAPLALGGCGDSGVAATPARSSTIAFMSPSFIGHEGTGAVPHIPVQYTCDGSNTTPSFRWGSVPSSTASLVLFLFKVGHTGSGSNGSVSAQIKLEWAIAGLSPRVHEIPAGKLPHGVFVANRRYTICPAKGSTGTYVFQLAALSSRPAVGPRFNAYKLFQEAKRLAVAAGAFKSRYKRV
jgi:phosphatidylethanolamine-binding protein (PEBP) family uncharacterized protein